MKQKLLSKLLGLVQLCFIVKFFPKMLCTRMSLDANLFLQFPPVSFKLWNFVNFHSLFEACFTKAKHLDCKKIPNLAVLSKHHLKFQCSIRNWHRKLSTLKDRDFINYFPNLVRHTIVPFIFCGYIIYYCISDNSCYYQL